MINTWKRRTPALLAVALLSVPSALGVYAALLPTRGPVGAGLAAAGFEAVYISTAILLLTPDLREYARRVALAAVAVAIVLNTLADYQIKVPGGLASTAAAARLFDPLALVLSIVESAPLAGLAYAMAELLHRLGAPAPALVVGPERATMPQSEAPALETATDGAATRSAPKTYHCKRCGLGPMNFGELGRHARKCVGPPMTSAAD